MNLELTEAIRLDASGTCTIEQLAEVSGLSLDELQDLVEQGVIEPVDPAARPPAFYLYSVVTVKRARRLRDDFELDRRGLSLALTLLRRIERLEAELRAR
jgi:chaperone modulatory protein CbpM